MNLASTADEASTQASYSQEMSNSIARRGRNLVLLMPLFPFLVLSSFTGCGTPGAPQPPSLKLPELVNDLTAVRAGSTVTLHWTMPKKTTDHLLISSQIRGPVPVRVCRREGRDGACQPVGEVAFAAGADGVFHDTLPAALTAGPPRQLLYFVELRNKVGKSGRSAGLSNSAVVAAGATPAAITGLTAEVRADGVALHWNVSENTAVRLHRKLLSPSTPKEKKSDGLSMNGSSEPVLRDLIVEPPAPGKNAETSGGALDTSARFGEVYEYTAQRIERVSVDGKNLELAGDISATVHVEMIDTFPPAIPQGLAAVLVAEEKTIDLSWQPDSEEDLAAYIVYRANGNAAGDAVWKRISTAQPITGPAFRDTTIEPGHSYSYSVSAVDQTGHESHRSAPAQESVPNP